MKQRTSNFELLRIIAMLLIISGHLASDGGLLESAQGINKSFVIAACSGARISVNLFLMLGCWFMVDSYYSTKRIIKLYSQVWFYSALITTLLVLSKAGLHVSAAAIIKSYFPFTFGTLWFASVYIMLLLLAPFLNKIFQLKRTILRNLLIILFVLISVISTVSGFLDTYLCGLVWFVFIYLFIGYYKKHLVKNPHFSGGGGRKGLFLLLGLSMYAIAVSIRIVSNLGIDSTVVAYVGKIITIWIKDYKSVPNFLCSILIFIFFTRLDIGSKKAINSLAKGTFAAYILHQIPAVKYVLWHNLFRVDSWSQTGVFVLCYIGTVICVYLTAVLVDYLRIKMIEPLWLKGKFVQKISEFGDKFIDEKNI